MSIGQLLYQFLARPALFILSPERGQRAAESVFMQTAIWKILQPYLGAQDSSLETNLCGLKLSSPVGLAAGFDKDCQMLPSLSRLGFGYLVGGTVLPQPQPGNPSPSMLRKRSDHALINSLGFPSRGLETVAAAIKHRTDMRATPLVMSISGLSVEEMIECHTKLEPLCDAIEVNISSPNTEALRLFQQPDALLKLLGRLNEKRHKPLFVKLPRYQPNREGTLERVMELARVCRDASIDGVTMANTRPIHDRRLAVGSGGLSGPPLFHETLALVKALRGEIGEKLAINACGGITTGEDVWEVLQAGATTVQLYTAMVYRGPAVVRDINRRLVRLRKKESR